MNKLTKIAAASVVAMGLGLGMAGQAQAAPIFAYAYSHDKISNFGITFSDPNAVWNSQGTTSSDAAVHPPLSEAWVNLTDAKEAFVSNIGNPPRPANNTFGQLGQVGDYARGDAALNLNTGYGENVAETYNIHLHDISTGNGINELTGSFTLRQDGTVSVQFDADAFMQVEIGSGNKPGSYAQSQLTFLYNITSASGTVDNFDVAGLNHSISAVPGGLLSDSYTFSQIGINHTSATLLAGSYNVNVRMVENVSAYNVPEPGSIFLLGIGLMGLVYGRRKMVHSV
jgi:hypothetical protein